MTARTLVAAHLRDNTHLWYAAHLRVDDPALTNIVWKPEPTIDFDEISYLRWATLAEVQCVDPRGFEIEVTD